jgi:phenylacetate-coenzyme A ligase PaaK-like adenylate-forming protein
MISPVNTWTAARTGLSGNLNPETLRQWQREKLKGQIRYANKNSAFYRNQLPDDCELTELPFTSPCDIVYDPFAFLAVPQSLVARVTTLSNSGTTSQRKRIFFSKADLERTMDFFAAGMSTMTCKGEHAQILLSNKTENSLGSLLRESLSRIGVISEIPGAIKTANKAIEASRGSDCLIGMPAEILYMSRTAPDLRPKSVLLAADYAPQSVINSIKETWKCDVFTHYGHTEFGFGCAVDCRYHNGHHLRDADLIFEIIDLRTGKPSNPGERGEIVITTLSNEAMPLIRYRTSNISLIINEPCGCGSILPRLGRIEGRIENNIKIDNNNILSIHKLDEIIFADPSVLGFNAILRHEGERKTLLLTVDSFNSIDLNSLSAILPQGLNLEVKYSKADPFSHRGKRGIHHEQG